MSINKKELIAQISQNVKAPGGETLAVEVGRPDVLPANEEQKVQVQEKARKISRTKSKPVVPAFHGSSGRQAAFWLEARALTKLGMAMAASKAMMATTIMISTRVKPALFVLLTFI